MNARELRQAELEGEIENATRALENQLNDYKEKGSNVLLILGIMVSAYTVFRLISDDDTVNENVNSESKSGLGSLLIGVASSVAIGLAKDQIIGFIEKFINERKA